MDYDRTIAKVAKAYMLICGDGRSNIAACDGLNSNNWDDDTVAKFMTGKGKERKLKQFDIIATNPPFAGDISNDDTLTQYELAYKLDKKGKRKKVNKLGKEKLFIERCLNMLVLGGRMAIVLPRGIMKNYSDERIRRYIMEHAIIIGVIGLGGNMFKPFTNTKTIVLFVQKRYKPLSEGQSVELGQNNIVCCVTEKSGKDKTGKIITGENGEIISDLDEITKYFNENTSFLTEEQYCELIEKNQKESVK